MDRNELRKKWIEALRSGRFKQGRTALRTGDKYCCLGVACEIAGLSGVRGKNGIYTYNGRIEYVPLELQRALGLYSQDGAPRPDCENPALTFMNDNMRATFNEIATALETGVYWTE
jgi:hypothetical protein